VEDEDDLHLTLKVEKPEDGALFFEISDEVGNKKHFDTNGYLVYIEDAVGNRRVFTRDANHRVTAISLVPKGHSEISQLTLTYSGGLLSGVTNIVAGISAALSYNTDGYLTAITYTYPPDGSATVTFAYDGAGRLTLAKDEKGCRALGYSYDDSGRVIEVTEYAFADASSEMTAGQRAGISYATRQTVYRTAGKDDVFGNGDDVYAVYGFNMSGKLVSAYTTDGATVYGAGNYEYDGESNRISSVMSTGGMTVNHLANPGFDSVVGVMPLLWETSGTVYSRFSVTDFSENRVAALSASGNGSSTAAIKQKFHLAEGTYTFSARLDMHAMYTAQGGVRLVIYREDGSAISEGYVRNRMVNQGGQETYSWETVHVTFAVTGTACEAQGWYAAIELYHPEAGSSSAVYVDSAMLETGSVVSAYSSVHGSFDSGASDWTGGTVVSGESLDGTRALCVTGNVLQARRASITVHLEHGLRIESDSDTGRTQKPATLVLSGWAKANAVPNGARAGHEGGSLFGLRAVVHYYDTNATTTHEATFTTSVEDWQFISLDICPMYDTVKHGFYGITSIDIYCVYDYNVGNAYFDNISLIRDSDCVVNYFYNADGKIVGTSTSDSNSESYTYAENGVDVERVTDELGNEYDYGYDGQHRVETSVNASGNVVYDPDVEYSGIYSIDYTNYTVYSVYDDEGNYGNLMKTYQIGKYNRTMLESSVTYNYSDAAFSAVATETDAAGGVTRYFYRNNGLLHGMCDPNGNGLVYSYNAFGQLTRAVAATYDAATNTLVVPEQGEEQHDVTYSYDGKGQLTGIDSDGALYTFLYDVFGNATEVRLGSDVLATYEYAANNGKLKRMSYGNGTYVLYEYDAVDRVVGICYNGRETAVYSYFYNANGQVAEHTDLATGICYEYNYDASGRMLQETAKKSNASDLLYFRELEYDIYGRIVSHYVYFLDTPAAPLSLTEYAYNAQGNIGEVNLANISKLLTYSYDEHGRVSSKYLTNWTDHENRTVYLGQSFTYERGRTVQSPVDNGNAYTNTGHLKMHTIEDADGPIFISQDYDAAGNITEIRTATLGVLHAKAHFHYDKLGQLVREDQWFADTSTASFTAMSSGVWVLMAKGSRSSGIRDSVRKLAT